MGTTGKQEKEGGALINKGNRGRKRNQRKILCGSTRRNTDELKRYIVLCFRSTFWTGCSSGMSFPGTRSESEVRLS
jgi:hypothetical protein